MSEGETGFLAQADRVLKLLMDERVKPGADDLGALSRREVVDALGMTWEQFRPVAIYLMEQGYAGGDATGGPDGGDIWIEGPGIEFYERRRHASPLHIAGNVGAIFNAPAHGAQIQAVASAVYSSVQQVVEGAQVEDIRQALTQTIENMVRAVQPELTVEELAAYTRIASEFRQEVAKENPDKARLWRALPVLSFLGDVEGTIQLAERAVTLSNHVAPYFPLLVTLLARLFSSLSYWRSFEKVNLVRRPGRTPDPIATWVCVRVRSWLLEAARSLVCSAAAEFSPGGCRQSPPGPGEHEASQRLPARLGGTGDTSALR